MCSHVKWKWCELSSISKVFFFFFFLKEKKRPLLGYGKQMLSLRSLPILLSSFFPGLPAMSAASTRWAVEYRTSCLYLNHSRLDNKAEYPSEKWSTSPLTWILHDLVLAGSIGWQK